MNDYQKERFVRRMIAVMFNTLAGKRITLFGFAFKANTDDVRDSPAIQVCRDLVAERADVCVTDPRALDHARQALEDISPAVTFEPDPYRAVKGAHAIALLTDWEEYRYLDYARIYADMERPAFVFDGRNLLDPQRLHDVGFNVYSVGRPPRTTV